METVDALLQKLFPSGEFSGAAYYVFCAVLFIVGGMVVGYFIWRKGHMQTLDAEAEIRRTKQDLSLLQEDLSSEEQILRDNGLADT